MKKVAIGCLAVFVVVVVVGAVLGYFFVWRPASGYIASLAQLGQLAEIDRQVANRTAFSPPSGNALTRDMVSRFMNVQEQMRQTLGARFAEMKTKYDQLERVQKAEHRDPTFTEAMAALKDLTTLLVIAKRAQVEALNKTGFSLEEYRWVRGRVYNAAGILISEMDLTRLAEMAKQGGRDIQVRRSEDEEVPDVNRELVKPYTKKLEEWAPLAFFGL